MRYIIFALVLILVVWYFFFRKKHKFWDHQPVSRGVMKYEGIISETIPSPLTVKSPNEIVTVNPTDASLQKMLPRFLNKHYVNEYTYDNKYVSWILDFPGLNTNNMTTIQQHNNVIGTILSKPHTINLNGKLIHSHYVDKLSVHENHRNKNYAPVLISNMLKNSCDDKYKTCIFKKEDNPLPFNNICKTSYCVYDITKPLKTNESYSLIPSTDKDFDYMKQLYQNESVKYKCYPVFDTDQMKYIFTSRPGVYDSLLIKVDDVPKGFLTYSINSIRGTKMKRAEITLLIGEDINLTEVIKLMVNRCHSRGITEVMCVNIAKNDGFISDMKFTSEMPVYFQMYNYNLLNSLKPSDILYNFI